MAGDGLRYDEPVAPEDIARGPKGIWSTEKALEIARDFAEACPDRAKLAEMLADAQARKVVSVLHESTGKSYEAKFSRHARKVAGAIQKYMDANNGSLPSRDSLESFRIRLAAEKRRILMQKIGRIVARTPRMANPKLLSIRKA